MLKINRNWWIDFYSISIVFLPIIRIFKSPFVHLQLAQFFLILLVPVGFTCFCTTIRKKPFLLLLYIYILFSFILTKWALPQHYLLQNGLGTTFFTILVLGVHVYFFSDCVFDINIFGKWMYLVSLSVSLLLIIQCFLFYIFGVYINFFPSSLVDDGLNEVYKILNEGLVVNGVLRASSIFTEPSSFSEFSIVGLVWILFGQSKIKHKFTKAFFISIAIILSTSGLGIASCVLAWIIYGINYSIKSEKKLFSGIILSFILILLVVFFSIKVSFIGHSFSRIIKVFSVGVLSDSRTQSIDYYNKLPFIQKCFGHGFASEPDHTFFSGISVFLYRIGFVGTGLFFFTIYYNFKNLSLFSKVSAIIYTVLLLSADVYKPEFLCFYLFTIYGHYLLRN